MKTLFTIMALVLMSTIASFGQCGTYTTSGSGDYFTTTNWVDGLMPPNPIPSDVTVAQAHAMTISSPLENNGIINATGFTLSINSGGNYGGIGTFNGEVINNGIVNPGTFATMVISTSTAGLTTEEITSIAETTAVSGGDICYEGGSSVTVRGLCWSTSVNPTIVDNITTDGSGIGSYSSNLTGLAAATLYYVRAYATNSVGTSYGQEKSFITTTSSWACGDPLVYDGQSYATVQIGGQCWMAENLNVGTMIPSNNSSDNQTNNSTIEKYCFDNNAANCTTYGGLYQWDEMMQYSTTESTQGICPTGWHLPSDGELTTLTTALGGTGSNTGSKMAGNAALWNIGNLKSDPDFGTSGLAVLPAGYRDTNGSSYSQGNYASLWSSTESGSNAWCRSLYYDDSDVDRNINNKDLGFSVRCVRD